MAQLIDKVLVGVAVGLALWAVIKYFRGLMQVPQGSAVKCSGCSTSCHADMPAKPSTELIRNIKTH